MLADKKPPPIDTEGSAESPLGVSPFKESIGPSAIETVDPKVNYDTIVQEPLGQMGYYSIFVLLIVELGMVSVCGTMLSLSYHNIPPVWTCNSDIRDNAPDKGMSFYDISILRNVTLGNESSSNWSRDSSVNNCSCPTQNRSYFDKNGFESMSLTFELICERKYLSYRLATLIMCGGFFGSIVFGQLGDKFGRKWIGVIALGGNSMVSCALYFSNSYAVVSVLITILGFFGAGYMVVGIVTVIEFVGRDFRLFVSCLHGWPLGLMYMGLIGFMTRNWRVYHLAMGLSALPFLLGWIYLGKSPRWLVRMHRLEEAERAIQKIAKFNRAQSESLTFAKLEHLYEIDSDQRNKLQGFTYLTLLGYPKLLLLVGLLCLMWFSSAVISWGIYLNVGSLAGNIYLNFFLSGLAKGTVGFVVPLTMNICCGRRSMMINGVLVSSICIWVIVGCLVYQEKTGMLNLGVVVTASAIVALSAIDITWKVNHLYANELFPTVVRTMANGLANSSARVASIILPQIMSLGVYFAPGPYILMGVLGVLHLFAAILFLPETKGKPLPDSLPPKLSEKNEKLPNADRANEDGEGLGLLKLK